MVSHSTYRYLIFKWISQKKYRCLTIQWCIWSCNQISQHMFRYLTIPTGADLL